MTIVKCHHIGIFNSNGFLLLNCECTAMQMHRVPFKNCWLRNNLSVSANGYIPITVNLLLKEAVVGSDNILVNHSKTQAKSGKCS